MQLSKLSKNLLLNTHSENVIRDLFKVAWQFANKGHTVLYLIAKPLESLPLDENDPMAEDLMERSIIRNIIFKYPKDADELWKTLLNIPRMQLKPRLIIVDFLHTFFTNSAAVSSANAEEELNNNFINKHLKIIATVQHMMSTQSKILNKQCYSIVCSDDSADQIYDSLMQSIVDQYYYEANVIFDTSTDLLEWFNSNPPQ